MKTVNLTILMGHVASEISTTKLENGTQFSQFALKTREFFKSGGETKKEVNYHNCIAWNGISKSIEEILNRNELVHIRGRLKTKKIMKDGEKPIYKTEVVIEEWSKISYTDVEGFVPSETDDD